MINRPTEEMISMALSRDAMIVRLREQGWTPDALAEMDEDDLRAELKLTLSQMASKIWRLEMNAYEAFEYDCQFDGGEFSGPALDRMLTKKTRQLLEDGCWDAKEFMTELSNRIDARWIHFNYPMQGLENILDEDYQRAIA